jgi:hypothetical protein
VVAQDAGRLVRVDPGTRKVQSRIRIGTGARLVTTGLGAVWVSHFVDGRVLRVEPHTGQVRRSAVVCAGPQGLVTARGRVWVACTSDDVVVELDPHTLRVLHRTSVPGAPDPLVTGLGGTVLAVSQAGPTVTVLGGSGQVLRTRRLGAQPDLADKANVAAVVAGGRLWVSSFYDDAVLRVPLSALAR